MIDLLRSIFRSIIRTLSFPHKEIVEILRQPRLVLTLILGPFLILLLVGIGYRSERPPLRTLFVIDQDDPLKASIERLLRESSPHFNFLGSVNDQAGALDRLGHNEVDLVIVAPKNVEETVRANQQAVFTIYHREIDPTQIGYVAFLGRIYTDEANRQLLQSLTAEGQSSASDVQTSLADARSATGALRDALQRGDMAAARQHQGELSRSVTSLEAAVGASATLLAGASETTNSSDSALNTILADLTSIRQDTEAVTSTDLSPTDVQRISAIEEKLGA